MTDTIFSDPYVRVHGPDTEQLVLAALGGAVGPDAAGEYTAVCPAHPDQVRSLRFRSSVDGRALMHCHAGCSFEEIRHSLGLEVWQLAPVRVEYDYIGPDSDYRFTVVREHGADGSKKLWQGVRSEDGRSMSHSVDGVDRDLLFRTDEIRSAGRGPCQTLWLLEGEKDAAVVAGWLAGAGRNGEYATTLPGGAAKDWTGVIGRLVEATGATTVIVVCDRDRSGAGQKRGRLLSRILSEEAPDVAVQVVLPTEGGGKDAAELIDRFKGKWESHLEEYTFDPTSDALIEYGASGSSGQMIAIRVMPAVSREVLAMVQPGKEDAPRQVLTGSLEPMAVHQGEEGREYVVEVRSQMHVAAEYETTIRTDDMASGQAMSRWLSRQPDFGRAPLCGVGPGEIADGLRLYLDHRVRVAGRPILAAPDACGWIDAETGRNADRAGSGRPLVFVDDDGKVVAGALDPTDAIEHGFCPPGRKGGGEYGFAVTETDAAWALWQALTFADADVTAPVLGFVAATILSPFLAAAGSGLRPGLTIVAPSGSGKTHGAAALILGLAGCTGHQASTEAGMRRRLEGGVGTVVWVDDSSIVESERVKEWMRVCITRSEFTMADADAGSAATVTGSLTAVPVVSSEGIGWLAETAMRDRFVVVHPGNPQGRTSKWPGRGSEAQWADFVRVERDLLGGRPTRGAGRVVAGIVEAARRRGAGSVWKGVEKAFSGAGEGGVRREWARASAAAGLEVALDWMAAVRTEAGANWPGATAGEWANDLKWVQAGFDAWAEVGVDPDAAAGCSLVDEAIPRILLAHVDSVRVAGGHSEYLITGIDGRSQKEMVDSLRIAVKMGSGDKQVQRGLPPLVVDAEERLWVRSASVASVYAGLMRGRAETRTTGATALAAQLMGLEVGDDPEWATFKKGGITKHGCRVRMPDGSEAVYRRLSEGAARRARA